MCASQVNSEQVKEMRKRQRDVLQLCDGIIAAYQVDQDSTTEGAAYLALEVAARLRGEIAKVAILAARR